ncbi:hypothetical protein Btru_009031 [Bulinus truncatus]|nr:hypothetical protein Btru_009031 [Bulinus truncatus]
MVYFEALCQRSALKPISFLNQPQMSVGNKTVTVVVGDTAILPCSVENLGDYKLQWENSSTVLAIMERILIRDNRFSVERPFLNDWNLHIRKVRAEDAWDDYTCMISTNPAQSSRVRLVVHEPPTIIDLWSTPTTITVKERTHVDLVCNVTGNPPPSVTWSRVSTGQWLDQGPAGFRNVISSKDGAVLVLPNITRYCDDIYECVAFNGVDPAATREIRVDVQFAPVVTLATHKMGQPKGNGTVLACEVVANPHGVSLWTRNGKGLTKSTNHDVEFFDEKNKIILNLKIHNVQEADYGEYECYAENFLGSDSEIMILHEPKNRNTASFSSAVSPLSMFVVLASVIMTV